MIQPRFETLTEKKLIGIKINMSLAQDKTGELWRSFMPRRKEITNAIGTDLFNLKVFSPSHFLNFSPQQLFEKWALVEVNDFTQVPEGMETFVLPGGFYAVFHYKGLNTDTSIFQYIYGQWMPQSEYMIDNRPHFEIMGEKYNNNDPESEEDIWIPIKPK